MALFRTDHNGGGAWDSTAAMALCLTGPILADAGGIRLSHGAPANSSFVRYFRVSERWGGTSGALCFGEFATPTGRCS